MRHTPTLSFKKTNSGNNWIFPLPPKKVVKCKRVMTQISPVTEHLTAHDAFHHLAVNWRTFAPDRRKTGLHWP